MNWWPEAHASRASNSAPWLPRYSLSELLDDSGGQRLPEWDIARHSHQCASGGFPFVQPSSIHLVSYFRETPLTIRSLVCVLRTLAVALFWLSVSPPLHAGSVSLGTAMRALRVTAEVVRIYGRSADGTYVLSGAELSTCLDQQNRLQNENSTLDTNSNTIKLTEVSFSTRFEALRREAEVLNKYDAAAVERYNEAVSVLQSEAEAHEQFVDAFNQSVDKHNVLMESFNANCAGRWYYVDDMPNMSGR